MLGQFGVCYCARSRRSALMGEFVQNRFDWWSHTHTHTGAYTVVIDLPGRRAIENDLIASIDEELSCCSEKIKHKTPLRKQLKQSMVSTVAFNTNFISSHLIKQANNRIILWLASNQRHSLQAVCLETSGNDCSQWLVQSWNSIKATFIEHSKS